MLKFHWRDSIGIFAHFNQISVSNNEQEITFFSIHYFSIFFFFSFIHSFSISVYLSLTNSFTYLFAHSCQVSHKLFLLQLYIRRDTGKFSAKLKSFYFNNIWGVIWSDFVICVGPWNFQNPFLFNSIQLKAVPARHHLNTRNYIVNMCHILTNLVLIK